ncbi:hypothetical protein FVE85_0166 [Porphyridium purpureum]|uniref:SWIM-type domain-containing protein n=1 Tax=Porphyridium purpureum TaxID=35688 RepID=A0A5J4Z184_PORPP|nr:hypothetical protein FVE85_0166 [Porphyridium purpureum]|eukprot:POR0314..scf208_2
MGEEEWLGVVLKRLERAASEDMQVLGVLLDEGAMSAEFSVQGASSSDATEPYKVLLAAHPYCSCPDFRKRGGRVQNAMAPCKHMLFVMVRALALPMHAVLTEHGFCSKASWDNKAVQDLIRRSSQIELGRLVPDESMLEEIYGLREQQALNAIDSSHRKQSRKVPCAEVADHIAVAMRSELQASPSPSKKNAMVPLEEQDLAKQEYITSTLDQVKARNLRLVSLGQRGWSPHWEHVYCLHEMAAALLDSPDPFENPFEVSLSVEKGIKCSCIDFKIQYSRNFEPCMHIIFVFVDFLKLRGVARIRERRQPIFITSICKKSSTNQRLEIVRVITLADACRDAEQGRKGVCIEFDVVATGLNEKLREPLNRSRLAYGCDAPVYGHLCDMGYWIQIVYVRARLDYHPNNVHLIS